MVDQTADESIGHITFIVFKGVIVLFYFNEKTKILFNVKSIIIIINK